MKKLKHLACLYPLVGAFTMSWLMCNITMVLLLTFLTQPFGIVFTHTELNLLFWVMTVTTNLFMTPIFMLLSYPLIEQFRMDFRPTTQGIYEWFEKDRTKRLVVVWNVFEKLGDETNYLRVCWGGSYYDVHSRYEPLYNCDGKHVRTVWSPSEWTDGTWGKRIGDIGSIDDKYLYLSLDK